MHQAPDQVMEQNKQQSFDLKHQESDQSTQQSPDQVTLQVQEQALEQLAEQESENITQQELEQVTQQESENKTQQESDQATHEEIISPQIHEQILQQELDRVTQLVMRRRGMEIRLGLQKMLKILWLQHMIKIRIRYMRYVEIQLQIRWQQLQISQLLPRVLQLPPQSMHQQPHLLQHPHISQHQPQNIQHNHVSQHQHQNIQQNVSKHQSQNMQQQPQNIQQLQNLQQQLHVLQQGFQFIQLSPEVEQFLGNQHIHLEQLLVQSREFRTRYQVRLREYRCFCMFAFQRVLLPKYHQVRQLQQQEHQTRRDNPLMRQLQNSHPPELQLTQLNQLQSHLLQVTRRESLLAQLQQSLDSEILLPETIQEYQRLQIDISNQNINQLLLALYLLFQPKMLQKF